MMILVAKKLICDYDILATNTSNDAQLMFFWLRTAKQSSLEFPLAPELRLFGVYVKCVFSDYSSTSNKWNIAESV